MLFRDKLRITFNFSPDKGKHNKNIDVDADLAEVKEAQEEYKSGAGGSNLSSPTPPTRKKKDAKMRPFFVFVEARDT